MSSSSKSYHTKGEYSTNVVRSLNPTVSSYSKKSSKSETWKDGKKVSEHNVNYATRDGDVLDEFVTKPIKDWDIDPMITDGQNNYQFSETRTYKSPDVRTYKTSETRPYKSPGNGTNQFNETSSSGTYQLDSLLEDLKHERELTKIKDFNQKYLSSANLEDVSDSRSTRNETITRTNVSENRSNIIQPELSNNVVHSSNVIKTTSRTVNDGNYGTNNYGGTSTVIQKSDLAQDLKDMPVIDEILPLPGTKVKTTIRTYEYEIPQDLITSSQTTLLRQDQNNYGVINNKIHDTIDRNYNTNTTSSHYRVVDSKLIPNTTVSQYKITENIQRNDIGYPNDLPHSPHRSPRSPDDLLTTPHRSPRSPDELLPLHHRSPRSPDELLPSHHRSPRSPDDLLLPQHRSPRSPDDLTPKQTYYYKHESSNTTNTHYGQPAPPPPVTQITSYNETTNIRNISPPQQQILYPANNYPVNNYPVNNYPANNYPPNNYPVAAPPPSTHSERITERHYYTDHSSTRPFPVDQGDNIDGNVLPPKRLDDLMATFPHENGYSSQVNETTLKREINTSTAKPGQVDIEKTPTKNVQGPAVYYPPGQEMTLRKEEGGAAWRAQGGYAKASGKYEYGAESSSKSKSKSGAAVVPVCLPLCCAMPCSIM